MVMYYWVGSGLRLCTIPLSTKTQGFSRFSPSCWYPLMPQGRRSLKRLWVSPQGQGPHYPQRPQLSHPDTCHATLCFPCWKDPILTTKKVGKIQ